MLLIEHGAQRGAQGRDSGPHSDKHQISSALLLQIKAMPGDAQQRQSITFLHFKNRDTCANRSLHENLQFRIVRRTGKSEIGRLAAVSLQNCDLSRSETDVVGRHSLFGN